MSEPSSPRRSLLALAPIDRDGAGSSSHPWQPILQVSNQVVLYNPTSHAISIRAQQQQQQAQQYTPPKEPPHADLCPYCHRPLPEDAFGSAGAYNRHDNYFKLLEVAHEAASRPSTPPPVAAYEESAYSDGGFTPDVMAQGYFKAFFKEEKRLGMGANGTVYLCQHVLDGNPLGRFAVKKIAIGESHSYLLKILGEVRLLETLHHPNIITYHHAWLETSQFSSFGPRIPTLHVLMQWAEAGSLDDFIDARLGLSSSGSNDVPEGGEDISDREGSKAARIRAFRAARKRDPQEERERRRVERARAVHLMSAEEVRSLFGDVVEGLAFLHGRSILHLDLKPGNVLLTWDNGKLIPRAMLSDFGTSRDMVRSSLTQRSGNTGTLEYTSPESLRDPQTGALGGLDSKADMWSLGMVLHRMLFFRLPYLHASGSPRNDASGGAMDHRGERETDSDALEGEVRRYAGFRKSRELVTVFESRRLPQAYLILLENLLNVAPMQRPACERVVGALRDGRLDPEPIRPEEREGNELPVALHHGRPQGTVSDLIDVERAEIHSVPDVDEKPEVEEVDDSQPHTHVHPKTSIIGEMREDSPLLALPAPPEYERFAWMLAFTSVPTLARLRGGVVRRRVVLVRVVKSCVLVAKVWTLSSSCAAERSIHLTRAFALIILLALLDSLSDSVALSVSLAVVHWLLLVSLCSRGYCCSDLPT